MRSPQQDSVGAHKGLHAVMAVRALMGAAALIGACVALAQTDQQQVAAEPAVGVQIGLPALEVLPQVGGAGRSGSVEAISTEGLKSGPISGPNGMTGWSVTIPGDRALATPAIVGGKAFVGGGFGSYEFYAFDARTGEPAWAVHVSDDGPTAAVVEDGCCVFNTESCTLFVCDAQTGEMIWSRWLGDPLLSQPAVAGGRVFMAYPEGGQHTLICLDLKKGTEYWKAPLEGDIISAPIVEGGSVYVTTFDGTVYRYSVGDGKCVWTREEHGTSAPWVQGDDVFVTVREDGEGSQAPPTEGLTTLAGLSGERNQKDLWTQREAPYLAAHVQAGSAYAAEQSAADAGVGFGGGAPATAQAGEAAANVGQATVRGLWEFQGSRPALINGALYNAMGNIIQAVDPRSGDLLWEREVQGDTAQLGGHMATPPAFAGDKMYVGTVTGELLCVDAESGDELWCFDMGEPIRYQPSVVEGRVYVGTVTGKLICLDTGDGTADGWPMWGGGAAHNGPKAP